jgi:hypothetical protein
MSWELGAKRIGCRIRASLQLPTHDSQLPTRMGPWSNGKTPGLHPGDEGSIPSGVH